MGNAPLLVWPVLAQGLEEGWAGFVSFPATFSVGKSGFALTGYLKSDRGLLKVCLCIFVLECKITTLNSRFFVTEAPK